ncbi:MAG: hypothetical protein MUE73_15390 [Planctomycetes bacterium]|jgi:hypothetical protein|nr:hypothetical protein [Planctomycetota bacterium]
MAYPDWKIHGDDTLAAYLPEREFRGILEKRITIPPDLAAILIRDGKLVDAFLGANFSVGGLWQRLKELFGGKHSLRLLVVDLKPFPLTAAIEAFTRDHVPITAELALEFQLNPEKPVDVMGLVADGRSLTKSEVFERVRPHLEERVLLHELTQHDAADLRANRGLQDRIQAEIMKEVSRVAGSLGLLARLASVNFGLTADEAAAIERRKLEREEAAKDFEHQRLRRELEREAQTTVFRLETQFDAAKVKAMTEAELSRLLLENQLSLSDARDTGARIAERKALAHEIEVAKERRLASYDQRLGDEENELSRTKLTVARKRVELEFAKESRLMELEISRLEEQQRTELQRDKIRGIQELEKDRERHRHELDKDEFRTKQEAELEKLRLQAAMDPDQILAIQAGLSPDVARIFAERARAGGDREALLREMLDRQGGMFDKAVEGMTRVGAAVTGHGAGAGPAGSAGGTVECPACHHAVPVSDRFCRNCGEKLRS